MSDDPLWPLRVAIPVTWRDLDAAGHVNNSVYFTYMETARLEAFVRARGARTRWQDIDMILARATCDFRAPLTLGDTVEVEVTPSRVGETSFTLRYVLREKASGRIAAEGESVQVMFDYGRNEKKPLPPEMRARLLAGVP